MFKKLFGGLGRGPTPPPLSQMRYPATSPANAVYNLLFCDDLEPFRPKSLDGAADWQVALFGPEDAAKVAALANDTAAESRVRALAFAWLRAHNIATPKGIVLGFVLEVALDQGLDVLAAYADGSVRYINRTGKMTLIEPGASAEAAAYARRLLAISQPVVDQLGPWDQPRRPPPAPPNVRLNFVVSDGLYFGEGPFDFMQQDGRAGPLIQEASQLLTYIVEAAESGRAS